MTRDPCKKPHFAPSQPQTQISILEIFNPAIAGFLRLKFSPSLILNPAESGKHFSKVSTQALGTGIIHRWGHSTGHCAAASHRLPFSSAAGDPFVSAFFKPCKKPFSEHRSCVTAAFHSSMWNRHYRKLKPMSTHVFTAIGIP